MTVKELTVLRVFRDAHLQNTEEGKLAIKHYYEIAPVIVAKIDGRPDAERIYSSIYDDLVCPCVSLISDGRFEEAYHLYKEVTLKLEKALVCKECSSAGLQRRRADG